jgi:arylsulfatase A-like enzyme
MNPGAYAIINQRWRYIHYDDGSEELYDVQSDPNEWENLAPKKEHAKFIARLKKSAPKSFAKPGTKLNRRRHLLIDGESYRWDATANPLKRKPAK